MLQELQSFNTITCYMLGHIAYSKCAYSDNYILWNSHSDSQHPGCNG